MSQKFFMTESHEKGLEVMITAMAHGEMNMRAGGGTLLLTTFQFVDPIPDTPWESTAYLVWPFLSQEGKHVTQETYKYRDAFSLLHA